MKALSKYLCRLCEEKLIAREDDGGGAPAGGGDVGGGVVNAPADAESTPTDVVPDEPDDSKTGLVTTDVLGKCDHKKDGFFGPGCFHLPKCVWSVPCYRYPKKKKRKKLKFANLVHEEDDYSLFVQDMMSAVENEIDDAQEYLTGIDPELKLEYDGDHEFEGEEADWVAALPGDQDDTKTIRIALNNMVMYNFLFDQGLEMDRKEIGLQVKVAVWHELGHAIIRYLEDMEIFDMELSELEEEQIVEEFAKYQIRKYSGVYKSRLNDFLNEMFFNDRKTNDEKDETVTETRGDVLTDFKHPINLADTHRRLAKNEEKLKSRKFIVSDMEIPGESNLFRDQNGKDVVAGINKHGLVALMRPIEPNDEDEANFMKLSREMQMRTLDIITNTEKYIDDPQDEMELELAASLENASDQKKDQMYRKYSRLVGGMDTIWFRPTLMDIVRICRVCGVNQLPLNILVDIDRHDNIHEKRYIESLDCNLNESEEHSYVKDMHYLQRTRRHFAPDRWALLTRDYSIDLDLGALIYKIRLRKRNGIGTNYIFSTGVLFGYDGNDDRLQTAYYIEPCEVVYMMAKGDTIEGNPKMVNMRLMWQCLQNVMEGKAFAGHLDRRQGY